MKNNVSLHTMTRIAVFIILSFAIYLLLAGHNNPGGGFIGALMTASAVVLLYISFDLKTIKNVLEFYFPYFIGTGLIIAIGTGISSMIFGYPFLTQFFTHAHLPILGDVELTTALVFDIGVYIVVVGVTLLIITTIAEDDV
ncbi:Na(+)/H(+) antiporter subunit B [Paraliobacillus ryukyuensis]|uniref:Multisubunit sodium/proton antiporter MrpB subunit n=1 Tax=Paraliobacillus ryukyuensis TaxID=200904 RepID=A0A366DXK0_9BACI|nr:Na(+)/H(+) antiporter subunit B [Paraliobacillus ryukyuensis]RBO94605.1 multisubunit sodium/proton antiporter MrpB subunit [Paraliobacillus ryukyuensis]